MYNLYNITVDKADEWQALEKIKRESIERGYAQGFQDGRKDRQRDIWHQGFDAGRAAGFAAGFAAAQQQPAAKIEAAYEQGMADAAKLVPVTKNGCGY